MMIIISLIRKNFQMPQKSLSINRCHTLYIQSLKLLFIVFMCLDQSWVRVEVCGNHLVGRGFLPCLPRLKSYMLLWETKNNKRG